MFKCSKELKKCTFGEITRALKKKNINLNSNFEACDENPIN